MQPVSIFPGQIDDFHLNPQDELSPQPISFILCIPIGLQKPLLIFYIRRVSHKVSVTSLYDFFIKHLPIGEVNISQKVCAAGANVRGVPSRTDILI